MKKPIVRAGLTLLLLLTMLLGVAEPAAAQPRRSDSVWEGVLIGGAVAAVGGFIIAPYALCGTSFDDSECVVIVRAALGLPIFVGGLVLGGLIDKWHDRAPFTWKSATGRRAMHIGPVTGRRAAGVGVVLQWR